MSRSKAESGWQVTELNRFLEDNAGNSLLNSKPVFLCNPFERADLQKIIRQHLWPAVLAALADSPVRVFGVKNGFPEPGIQDEKGQYTTCSLTFVLEDSEDPLAVGLCPPWYSRWTLECSVSHYMVSSEFYLYLPATIGFQRVHKLLIDPLFVGNPPHLSIDSEPGRDEIWTVTFSGGSGADWKPAGHQGAVRHLKTKIGQVLAVINAVNMLSYDYEIILSFKGLQSALHEAYQAF